MPGSDRDEVEGSCPGPAGLGWPNPSLLGTVGLALAILIVARAASEGSPEADGPGVEKARAAMHWGAHPIFALAWSPDGRRLAASGWGPEVRVWDPESGLSRSFDRGDDSPRFVLGWSADGRGLAVGDLGGRVEFWSPDRGPGEEPEAGPRDGLDVATMAGVSRGGSIRLWGAADERGALLHPTGSSANSVAFSPDGRSAASAGRDGFLRAWDVESGRILHETQVEGVGINGICYSPDGARLASAGAGPVRVWDAGSGRQRAALGVPSGGFSSVAFSPDGRLLAAASWGGRVLIWELATGRELASLPSFKSQVLALAWSPDGARLASAGHASTVRIWDVAGLR